MMRLAGPGVLQNELRLRGVKILAMDTQEALNLYLLLIVLLAQGYSAFPGHGAVAQKEEGGGLEAAWARFSCLEQGDLLVLDGLVIFYFHSERDRRNGGTRPEAGALENRYISLFNSRPPSYYLNIPVLIQQCLNL